LLALPWTPPGDAIAGMTRAWIEALEDHDWTCPADSARIRAAFKTLSTSCTQWPSPRLFLDALKPRIDPPPVVPRERRLSNDNICENGLKHIDEINAKLGIAP